MNPTYKVGDVVQIISEEEVYSCPTDDRGNFILAHFPCGADDFFHRDKLPICGCSAVITGISSITKGDGGNLYNLTYLFAKDKTVFHWDEWCFSAAEFRPLMDLLSIVSLPPVPSMSLDDLLKGATS